MIIPFMKLKWFNIGGSLLALVAVLVLTYTKFGGFALGLDFAGGIKIEVENNDKINIESIRNFLSQEKIEGTVQKADKTSQDLLKLEIGGQSQQALTAAAEKDKVKLEAKGLTANSLDFMRYKLAEKLTAGDMNKVVFASQNLVGPTVGKYMRTTALYLITAALILITIYVAFRFKLNYAVGALFSSLHDLVLTIGVIGILQIPLSIPVVAALMTILGYSINDTIVIFDRIRENSAGQEELGMDKIVDKSIMQTLTRTINTTTTTLLAIIPIYILGDEGLKDLATVLIFGILIGTYSSNFVASPIVVIWDNFMKRRKA